MLSRCNLKAIVFNDLYCAMAVCRHAEQSPSIDLRSSCEEWSCLCYSKYKREENLILCVGACMLVPLYCIYCILFLERAAPGMHFNSDIACCISAIRVNSLDDWHLALKQCTERERQAQCVPRPGSKPHKTCFVILQQCRTVLYCCICSTICKVLSNFDFCLHMKIRVVDKTTSKGS